MSQRIYFAADSNGQYDDLLLEVATAAAELGYVVSVVAPADSAVLDRALKSGFVAVAIRGTKRRQYFTNLRGWDHAARDGLLWCIGLDAATATAGRRHRVVHLQEMPRGKQIPALAFARRGPSQLIVPSNFLAERITGARPMWNWVPEVARAPRTWASSIVTIGFDGPWSEGAGADVLMRALMYLEHQEPGRFRLLLAGEAGSATIAGRDVSEIGWSKVAGLVEGQGMMSQVDYFNAIDVAVMPAVEDTPTGRGVAEAMSAKVPVVISNAGALPEMAGAGHPWVAWRGDPVDLAETIRQAAGTFRTRDLETAWERWKAHFSPEAGRRRLGEILSELMK